MASEAGAVPVSTDQDFRIPPPWGERLTVADYAALLESWITQEIADEAMLRRVDESQGREVVGQKGKRNCAGLLIPYYWPGEPGAFNYRLRRDHPDWRYDGQGNAKLDKKYLGPPKGANRLYVPPGLTLDQISDVSIPIALVEGEKRLWPYGGLPSTNQKHHGSSLSALQAFGTGAARWERPLARVASGSMWTGRLPTSTVSPGLSGGRSSYSTPTFIPTTA